MAIDPTISLTTVESVLDYMGIDAQQDAFWVYYSAAAATATVQVTLDRLILIHNAVTDANLDLTAVAYDTIGELVAAINALADWEAGVICHSSSVSINLLETGQLNALLIANKQTLRITGDYLIAELINRASDFMNRYCNRTLKETTYTLERYNGEDEKLFLNNYPVTAITQLCQGTINAIRVRYTSSTAYNAYVEVDQVAEEIKIIHDGTIDLTVDISSGNDDLLSEVVTAINAVAGWEATIALAGYNSYPSAQLFTKYNRYALNQYAYLEIPDAPIDDFDVDNEGGLINLSSKFSQGFQNIYVSFMAGYASGSIPASLESICIELVKYKYNLRKKDLGLKSETIGKVYKYEIGDLSKALPASLLDELDLYKRRLI